jgi:hypothetical protein
VNDVTAPNLELIERAITAAQLQTPLERAVWLDSSTTVPTAARLLRGLGFDQAPVRYGSGALGYVLLSDLETSRSRHVRRVTRGFSPEIVVAASSSVSTVLTALEAARFTFVLGDRSVIGFVTPSDLNKHAARTHFYLLISNLEINLAALIRSYYAEPGEALDLLPPLRRQRALDRYEEERAADADSDQIADLDFADILTVIARTPDLLQQFSPSARAWHVTTGRLDRLRNHVMHPTREFQGAYTDLTALSRMDADLRRLVERAELVSSAQPGAANLEGDPSRRIEAEGVAAPRENEPDQSECVGQPVTSNDLKVGQIRLKQPCRRLFPNGRADVEIVVRARQLAARYDDRKGPDRDRSPILRIGRASLAELVSEGAILAVSRDRKGRVHLD